MDNSATTKPYPEVINEMAEMMENYYGNPSSLHKLGLKAEKKLNEARELIARSVNASKDEIFFTSGGSESNNFLIKGFVNENGNIITTKIEHPSVLNTCAALEKRGIKVIYLDVDSEGKINIEELLNSIDKDTQVVSIMHVNNEIGTIQDIEYIGNKIKDKSNRVKFHVDAVQSYGKLKIDVHRCNIDLLSVSGHKIHGPRGIGFAYIKKGLEPIPLICGGGQEKGFRSGTENIAAIRGMSKAADIIYSNLEENYRKVEEVKKYFIDKLKDIEGVKVNSPVSPDFLPHILSASFIGVRAEVFLHLLEDDEIYASNGSACSSKNNKGSHVLRAIGLKRDELEGTLRFSFNEFNSKEEVDYVIESIIKGLKMLRRIKR